jgi:hypothetical protein
MPVGRNALSILKQSGSEWKNPPLIPRSLRGLNEKTQPEFKPAYDRSSIQFKQNGFNSARGLSGTKNALACMLDVSSGSIMRLFCFFRIEKSKIRQETVPTASKKMRK